MFLCNVEIQLLKPPQSSDKATFLIIFRTSAIPLLCGLFKDDICTFP